jgi:two-component system cell cycle response regulator
LAVLIADLDRFKMINDTLGHATGDEVLCRVARALAHAVRTSDLVARYGGEEFVAVAPDCPLAAAVSLAQRFRADLTGLTISADGAEVPVTASVGIAGTADTQHGCPAELFHQADQALYEAKRSGRDAIWVYDPSRRSPTVVVASGSTAGRRAAPIRQRG